jgi:hypothetical protein
MDGNGNLLAIGRLRIRVKSGHKGRRKQNFPRNHRPEETSRWPLDAELNPARRKLPGCPEMATMGAGRWSSHRTPVLLD